MGAVLSPMPRAQLACRDNPRSCRAGGAEAEITIALEMPGVAMLSRRVA